MHKDGPRRDVSAGDVTAPRLVVPGAEGLHVAVALYHVWARPDVGPIEDLEERMPVQRIHCIQCTRQLYVNNSLAVQ